MKLRARDWSGIVELQGVLRRAFLGKNESLIVNIENGADTIKILPAPIKLINTANLMIICNSTLLLKSFLNKNLLLTNLFSSKWGY